ncbi:MAG: hypothetical protein WDN06_10765 [Asticcacaulis sp.]
MTCRGGPDAVIALAEKAGDWQLANLTTPPGTAWSEDSTTPASWEQGVLFVGLTALAERSHRPEFRKAVFMRGRQTGWQPGPRPYHADEYVIASSYLWARRHGAGDAAIAPTQTRLDTISRRTIQRQPRFRCPRLPGSLVLVRRPVHGAAGMAGDGLYNGRSEIHRFRQVRISRDDRLPL